MKNSEYISRINEHLKSAIQLKNERYKRLYDAMTYSLNAGGKRIRPILTLEFCRIAGGNTEDALQVACAVEMLHTYSLIHDDLPCMDNDDLRRGRPTNHIVFGECNALLAGDALLTEAFSQISTSPLSDAVRIQCIRVLSDSAGLNGMCGGQYMDTNFDESFDERDIVTINTLKTGSLLKASCILGVVCAQGSEKQITAASSFGDCLGRAFQIRDDVLDVIGSREVLGKSVGSDKKEMKTNYMSLYGEAYCLALIEEYTSRAKEALLPVFSDTSYLFDLADSLIARNN